MRSFRAVLDAVGGAVAFFCNALVGCVVYHASVQDMAIHFVMHPLTDQEIKLRCAVIRNYISFRY